MQDPHVLNDVAQQMAHTLAHKVIDAIDGWPSSDIRDRPAILQLVITELREAQPRAWSR